MKILIMGLSGSGKTTLAKTLVDNLTEHNKVVEWFNADVVRRIHNDWDFSKEGRLRQCNRITDLANQSNADYVICDFIAPTNEIRTIFSADFTIWMDTISECQYVDTNKIFISPEYYDFRVLSWTEPITELLNFFINK